MARRRGMKTWLRRRRRSLRRVLRGRLVHLIVLAVCLPLVILPFIFPLDKLAEEQVGFRWRLFCYLDDHWGMHCPSGALIRSFSHCAKGELLQASQYYLLGPVLFLYLMLQIPYRTWALADAPRPLPRKPRRMHAVYTCIVIALIILDWLFLVGSRVV